MTALILWILPFLSICHMYHDDDFLDDKYTDLVSRDGEYIYTPKEPRKKKRRRNKKTEKYNIPELFKNAHSISKKATPISTDANMDEIQISSPFMCETIMTVYQTLVPDLVAIHTIHLIPSTMLVNTTLTSTTTMIVPSDATITTTSNEASSYIPPIAGYNDKNIPGASTIRDQEWNGGCHGSIQSDIWSVITLVFLIFSGASAILLAL